MRMIFSLLFLFALSCNTQPINEEQREKIKKNIKQREPVRVTEDQIISKAYKIGRSSADSLNWQKYQEMQPNIKLNQIWDAYNFTISNGERPDDNVQLTNDMVFYTRPNIKADTLFSMEVLSFTKKEIVLSIISDDQ